jgi:hypothetical protein
MRNPRDLLVQNAGAGDRSNPIYKGLNYCTTCSAVCMKGTDVWTQFCGLEKTCHSQAPTRIGFGFKH